LTSASRPDLALQERIQRIQDGLVPPVIIKGQPAVTEKLTDLMSTLHVPGVSIAVIHGGTIEWAMGFGVTKTGGPSVTPDTLFHAGALSRLPTAMAVLRLVDSGKLDLDEDVNRYLKTWKVPENSFTDQAKVTIRQLLMNTAGITVRTFSGYDTYGPVPTLVEVLKGDKPANNDPVRADMVPGTKWRYSSGGYAVIQQVLEDVTGVAFPKLLHDGVLIPIGMSSSTYEQPLPKSYLTEAAIPSGRNGEPISRGMRTFPEMGAVGLWASPSDLARFAIEVQRSLIGKSGRVLSSAMAREMLAPGPELPSPFDMLATNQGLGPFVGGGPNHRHFSHISDNLGFKSILFAYNDGDGAIIMTNGENGLQIAIRLLQTIAHEYGWPDLQPRERSVAPIATSAYDKFVGMYDLSLGGALRIKKIDDKLIVRNASGREMQLYPESDTRYFMSAADVALVFNIDRNGEVIGATLDDGRSHASIRKIKEVTVDPKIFEGYVGRFQFNPTKFLILTREGDHLLMQATNQQRFELVPENEWEFVPNDFPAKVTFEVDEQGRASRLIWLQNGQTTVAIRTE
jgi:CubicO group peptidase (beta-lactamase class C family)